MVFIPAELDETVRLLCELVKDRDEAQARVQELEKELEILRNDRWEAGTYDE